MAETSQEPKKNKHFGAIGGGELLGYFAGALANLLSETLLHKPKHWLDRQIGKHFIQPHLEFFTNTFRAFTPQLRRADHGDHMSDLEKATYIAGGMTNVLGSNIAGFIASYGGQRLIEGRDPAPLKSKIWSFVGDGTAHIGVMALQPTVFAVESENLKNHLSRIIQKVGFGKSYADNLAFSATYFMTPEIAGTIGRFAGHHLGDKRCRSGR